MHSATYATHLNTTADDAWSRVGDPSALADWHPGVASSPVNDDSRIVTLGDGAVIKEKILSVDKQGRSYSYRILESPLPIADYTATVKVVEEGSGCYVEWSATFEVEGAPPAEIVGVFAEVFRGGLGAVRDSIG